MTLYPRATDRLPDAGTFTRALPALLSHWTKVCVFHWQKWRRIRASGLLLDSMNDSALDELGMTRLGRGVQWLDCREAFPLGDFEYRLLRDDAGRGEAD